MNTISHIHHNTVDIQRLRQAIKLKAESIIAHAAYEAEQHGTKSEKYRALYMEASTLQMILHWIDDPKGISDYTLERFQGDIYYWTKQLDTLISKKK